MFVTYLANWQRNEVSQPIGSERRKTPWVLRNKPSVARNVTKRGGCIESYQSSVSLHNHYGGMHIAGQL